jgi:hypothetical protein
MLAVAVVVLLGSLEQNCDVAVPGMRNASSKSERHRPFRLPERKWQYHFTLIDLASGFFSSLQCFIVICSWIWT